jgi:uncharacterized membrane protein
MIKKIIKKVTFSSILIIILIPTIQEYININIAKDIWTSHDEYSYITKK